MHYEITPHFFRGAYRSAMRLALEEIELGTAAGDDRRRCQGWKLFFLLPRMLLYKPVGGGLVPKSRLLARFSAFSDGDWEQLLIARRECAKAAVQVLSRCRRTRVPTVDQRADRAEHLVHLGELSAARMGLEGDPIAPGNDATLQALQDPRKRPSVPREPLPREVVEHQPEGVIELDQERLLRILRNARRGAAGGPSGMPAEHLRPLLGCPHVGSTIGFGSGVRNSAFSVSIVHEGGY